MLSAFPEEQVLFSFEQVCTILGGVSRMTVWRMTKSGSLEVLYVRGRAMVTRGSLVRFLGAAAEPGYLASSPPMNVRSAGRF